VLVDSRVRRLPCIEKSALSVSAWRTEAPTEVPRSTLLGAMVRFQKRPGLLPKMLEPLARPIVIVPPAVPAALVVAKRPLLVRLPLRFSVPSAWVSVAPVLRVRARGRRASRDYRIPG
jgi:hypothetical protein